MAAASCIWVTQRAPVKSAQVSICKYASAEVGPVEAHIFEVGSGEVDISELRLAQVRLPQVNTAHGLHSLVQTSASSSLHTPNRLEDSDAGKRLRPTGRSIRFQHGRCGRESTQTAPCAFHRDSASLPTSQCS